MDLQNLVKEVTKKPIGEYIDNGFYAITKEQARTLAGNNLPGVGCEALMKMGEKWGEVVPSSVMGETSYIIGKTIHGWRQIWSIRER